MLHVCKESVSLVIIYGWVLKYAKHFKIVTEQHHTSLICRIIIWMAYLLHINYCTICPRCSCYQSLLWIFAMWLIFPKKTLLCALADTLYHKQQWFKKILSGKYLSPFHDSKDTIGQNCVNVKESDWLSFLFTSL